MSASDLPSVPGLASGDPVEAGGGLLSAERSATLAAFARACKSATRAVVLYPPEHPASTRSLDILTQAAQAATAEGPLRISVMPTTLAIGGRQTAKPDVAIAELAGLLHAHQIGQFVVAPATDAQLWRRFLSVLAIPPDQARLRGGLARLWSSAGQSQIEVRRVDFHELLRERSGGDRATWAQVVSECLEGGGIAADAWALDLVTQLLDRPDSIAEVLASIQQRAEGDAQRGADTLGGLLHAVARYVERTQPDDVEAVMAAIAEATARLPITTLAPLLKAAHAGAHTDVGRLVADLMHRVPDATIADVMAGEIERGGGTSPLLADAFCGLAPDPARRSAILNRARATARPGVDAIAQPSVWREAESYLLTYSDALFVPDAYAVELHRVADRAIDLDADQTDPPARIQAWTRSVDEAAVRMLDAEMIVDLMSAQHDVRRWRTLADLAISRIDMLVLVGDFSAATFLVSAIVYQAQFHDDVAVQTAASMMLDHLLSAAMMGRVATYLDTADRDAVTEAMRFCQALGTSIVGPLAETLSREERSRARQRLVEVLLGLGAAGRQAVEKLKQSPSAAVRRTAVVLLREFGGTDALGDLESLLNDAEPQVQRDATRAIAMMRSDAAFGTLTRALSAGTEHARTVITGVLSSIPDDDALPVLAYLVRTAPCRGPMWRVYERAVQKLGAIGGPVAVEALAEVMDKRVLGSPFKVAVLRRLAADALARIGTPDAIETLRLAASAGRRGARAAARRHLAAFDSTTR
ncbi:MAG: HEAT repeat domain-containing protein [Acidobacteriota bacterium]